MGLDEAYMRLWVRLKDTLSVTFLIPMKNPTDKQLLGFHISLPMGYVDITPYFCMYTENIADMANFSMDGRQVAPPHPLKGLADVPSLAELAPKQDNDKQWTRTPPEKQVNALAQVDIYLDNFISTCQGGPKERCQILLHFFRSIDTVFHPNGATDGLCKEPIFTNKLSQGDSTWYTKKRVLGWGIDTKEHHLRLTPRQDIKLRAALDASAASAHQVSLRKWRHILGLVHSITLSVAGAHCMFTFLQHALCQARGRQVTLSTAVQYELSTWRHIVQDLANIPTQIHKINPYPIPWEGTTDASGKGMGVSDKMQKASGSSGAPHFPQRLKLDSYQTPTLRGV